MKKKDNAEYENWDGECGTKKERYGETKDLKSEKKEMRSEK